jgi:hypothetical protein
MVVSLDSGSDIVTDYFTRRVGQKKKEERKEEQRKGYLGRD